MRAIYKITLFAALIFSVTNVFPQQTESERGIALYEQGNYMGAIESLQKSVEENKQDGISLRFLGMAYARIGDEKRALETFDKALSFQDKDLNVNYDIPVKIIKNPKSKYTKKALDNEVMGSVILFVEFGSEGVVKYVFPVKLLPDGLTESAITAAKGIKFKPAIKNNKAVTVIKFVKYSFLFY